MAPPRLVASSFVILLALLVASRSQPLDTSEIPVEVQQAPQDQVIYDQRQNGSENLRVQMSGVTVVLAPAEALMYLSPQDFGENGVKPKIAHSPQPKSRLTNLLMGFLNKAHH